MPRLRGASVEPEDELAEVHRSEGNHGWIRAAVPELLHLSSQGRRDSQGHGTLRHPARSVESEA
jgi:hypothetical protein